MFFLVVLLPILKPTIVLVLSLFLTLIGLFVTTKKLQKIKRNKPNLYYQKRITVMLGLAKQHRQYNVVLKNHQIYSDK